MSIKDTMNKEVEIDIMKFGKSIWNNIINLFNKLPRCINPEIERKSSVSSYPFESLPKPPASKPRELEVVDDDRWFDPDDFFNGLGEETRFKHAIKRIDDMTNNLTNRITIDVGDGGINDVEKELDDLVEQMFGAEDKWGLWDSNRDYPIDIKGRDITGKMIEQPIPPKGREIKD